MAKMNLGAIIVTVILVFIIITAIFGFLQTYQTWEERRDNIGKFIVSLAISVAIVYGIYFILTKVVVFVKNDGDHRTIRAEEASSSESRDENGGWWSGLKTTLGNNKERAAVGKQAYDKTYAVTYGEQVAAGADKNVAKAAAQRAAESAKQAAVSDVKYAQRAAKDPSRYSSK